MDYALGEASHEIEVSGDKFRWKEKGLVNVEGRMIPKAVQIYSPGPVAGDGFAYVSQYIRVRGECMGKKVDGWLGYDSIYFAAGVNYVASVLGSRGKRPGINCAWPSFANEYEDGSSNAVISVAAWRIGSSTSASMTRGMSAAGTWSTWR